MSLLYERRLESCYIERIYPYSESNAFLGVSICSRLFSEKTLIALFDWCKVNVKSVYVLIADEIQMYTFMASKGLERKEACAKALQIGDIKYRFIERVIKKGDYDNAVKYFDEALAKETDNDKKAEMAYATAAALMQAKKLSQARSYCQKAMSFKENYGEPYILLAQLYGSNPNWTDESALNKCTYFVVIDKLQRAKAVDPSVTERANELISTYSRHTPQAKDLFMLGYKAGDRITIGGWIGESTTIR